MQKAIQIAKQIAKLEGESCYDLLESVNLHRIFDPIFTLSTSKKEQCQIVCYIIYAYDNHSAWIEINQDRWENKQKIMDSLGCEKSDFWTKIIENDNSVVNEVIISYLQEITTWEWITITTQLDYHSKMLRYVSSNLSGQKVTSTDEEGRITEDEIALKQESIAKINKDKADILKKALEARQEADALLAKIRTEFVKTDTAVQADFGFMITDEKKIDIYSWRDYIRTTYMPMKERRAEEMKKRLGT